MQTLTDLTAFQQSITAPVALAAGFFDGVHLGHMAVLENAIQNARRMGGQAWALTFDRHPLCVLAPDKCPPLLSSRALRLELLAMSGLDGCLMLPFTSELASQKAADFIDLLCGRGSIRSIHSGQNWHFGHHGQGTPLLLTQLGARYGFETSTVPPCKYQGETVSSTRIRQALIKGEIDNATAMLGRPYILRETVVNGRGVGRTLGVATANIQAKEGLLPQVGVYAVRATVAEREINGVASIGFRPTFPDARPEKPMLEVHLLDFQRDIYGQTIDVAFIARLRSEIAFPDTESLKLQMADDIDRARALLA